MSFKDRVKATIEKYQMLSGGERVLVALSGGPDSVALLSVLKELEEEYKLTLLATYIDHGLRPKEVPEEIKFCENLCKKLSVEFSHLKIEPEGLAKQKGLSLQEAARLLRYEALKAEALRKEAQRIATGHHGSDQAETLLINLIRGSGMKGLSGIPPVRGIIIRPLIEVQKKDIEQYLKEKNLEYMVDSSNLKNHYLRNRVRTELIPVLERFNPSIVETLMRTAEVLRQESEYIDIQVNKTLMRLITRRTDTTIELFLSPLEVMDRVVLRRALRRAIDEVRGLRGITFQHIEDIIEFIYSAKTGDRLSLPDGYRVIKSYSTLIITSEPPVRIKERPLQVPGET
ncbi:MAG: tRNA lysidine(34) synthetase TilS, partial [Nitrospirae bacterium]